MNLDILIILMQRKYIFNEIKLCFCKDAAVQCTLYAVMFLILKLLYFIV